MSNSEISTLVDLLYGAGEVVDDARLALADAVNDDGFVVSQENEWLAVVAAVSDIKRAIMKFDKIARDGTGRVAIVRAIKVPQYRKVVTT